MGFRSRPSSSGREDSITTPAAPPRVVILGGGFGGLACAQALGRSDVPVTLIDKRNHNLFQPLLYQVATAALSPADIAEPIRKILRKETNITVVMGEVAHVDAVHRAVHLADGGIYPFDRLVIATGARSSYFGHDEWAMHAVGLKTIEDARAIRARLLMAFERAEICADATLREALMTTVVVGGGPTGVEMAGAVAELTRWTLARDFRNIDPSRARVVLIEAGPRLLPAFPAALSQYAAAKLADLGVAVRTNASVQEITADGVRIGEEFIAAGTVVWGAGARASPAATWLGIEGRGGRIPVDAGLEVEGYPGIFALGDTALCVGEDGQPLPALAQVAKQQGAYLGRKLRNWNAAHHEPFKFHNRGNTAVIGRNAAVFDFGRARMKGRLAWLLWALVHVYLLVSFEKRVLVSIQWLWKYVTHSRGARLIS
jgi:NADH dehydrogenase